MNACIYPGSFDPITNGHIDIICRARNIFPKVYVGVLNNTAKRNLFSVEERVEMIRRATGGMDGVEAVSFEGLLVESHGKALLQNHYPRTADRCGS